MRWVKNAVSQGMMDSNDKQLMLFEFDCDTISDLPPQDLYSTSDNTIIAIGSTADVIDPKSSYKMKSDGTWVIQDVGNDYYSKDQVDDLLDDKADKATTYTKAETDAEILGAITDLDVSSTAITGHYISSIEQVDGKISATATAYSTTPTPASTKLITSGGVYDAISGLISFDSIYGLGVRLPDTGIDADDYTTPGVFRMQTATGAGLSSNVPMTNAAFRLHVEYINNSNRIRQTFIPLVDSASFYIRNYTANGWRPWYKFEGVQV